MKYEKRVRKGRLVEFNGNPNDIIAAGVFLVVSEPKMEVWESSEILTVDLLGGSTLLPSTPVKMLRVVS